MICSLAVVVTKNEWIVTETLTSEVSEPSLITIDAHVKSFVIGSEGTALVG